MLFDQGAPAPLRRFLADDEIATAGEKGRSDLSIGDLIVAVEPADSDALVTTGRNLHYQQNLPARTNANAVIVQSAWPTLKGRAEDVAGVIATLKPGAYLEVLLVTNRLRRAIYG